MKLQTLILCTALGLGTAGCSKNDKAESSQAADTAADTQEPDISEVQPAAPEADSTGRSTEESVTIARQADGVWRETGASVPYSGTVVHMLDDTRWEEKFENGVRVSVRAWDAEGNRVELHAWNTDGSPREGGERPR